LIFTWPGSEGANVLDAFRIIWLGLTDFWGDFVLLLLFNLIWALATLLPTLPFFSLGTISWPAAALAVLLALPLPIVSGALCYVTNQVSRGLVPDLGMFATGVRRYWRKSLLVALINLLVVATVVINLRFYGGVLQGGWTGIIVALWLVASLYWLLAQIYWFPMILELENESVWLALRNSLAMVLVTPGFTLLLGLLLAVMAVLFVVTSLPAVLFLGSVSMLITNHATRSRLAKIQDKPYPPRSG
jgi:hypothetical protein